MRGTALLCREGCGVLPAYAPRAAVLALNAMAPSTMRRPRSCPPGESS